MNVSVRLSEKNRDLMEKLCATTHVTRSYYINKALEEYLEDQIDILEASEILSNTKKEDITEFDIKKYV